MKLESGDYFILISNLPIHRGPFYYAKRWEIEVLFGAWKTRGFNFEQTHLTKPKRINNLVALLSLALIWAVIVGEWITQKGKQIPIKKHRRKAKSIFRAGLDYIRVRLINNKDLTNATKLLSCT